MNTKLTYYLSNWQGNLETAPDAKIIKAQEQLGFILPKDYIDFMREFNGGDGEVGENSWLCLFPLEDLIVVNENYHFLMDQIPEYFLFGKDAADTGYGFHKGTGAFYSFGLMSNFKTDQLDFCGDNFIEFIEYLYEK